MQFYEEPKTSGLISGMKSGSGTGGKEPMHPDDFKALSAWVTAKRFHEMNR
jgi:hypothetical protein